MTLTNKETIQHLEKAKYGGLSNVMHRINIAGETKINRFAYDIENKKVKSFDTENEMTHVLGIDFNSLYPSVMAAIKNELIKYTDNIMHIPGRFNRRICIYENDDNDEIKKIKSEEMKKIIYDKKELFFVSIKAHFPEEKYNDLINFPPIIRPYFISDYFENPKIKTKKLTQLLSTMGEFMTFYSYYLWFLIDLGLIIDEYKEMDLFHIPKITFNNFIITFMEKRLEAISENKKGIANCCKIILNSSYGKDGMNTSKYSNIHIASKHRTLLMQGHPRFQNSRQIGDDVFAIQMAKRTYSINTPLQCSCACLDNAKYHYLNFIYNFMYKCLDMKKMHFGEGDTDSMYWIIAGLKEDGLQQGFKNVIIDQNFYDENVYKWLPDPNKGLKDEKKLLGLTVEKEGSCLIAISPKCYYLRDFNEKEIMKIKGLSQKNNGHITQEMVLGVIRENKTIKGENKIFRTQKIENVWKMTKQVQTKVAISALHNKMICLENNACAPFIYGLKREDYIIV
jgi:hypothetical protein